MRQFISVACIAALMVGAGVTAFSASRDCDGCVKDNCPSDCRAKCKEGCKTDCEGGCPTDCKSECKDDCEGVCPTDCKSECKDAGSPDCGAACDADKAKCEKTAGKCEVKGKGKCIADGGGAGRGCSAERRCEAK